MNDMNDQYGVEIEESVTEAVEKYPEFYRDYRRKVRREAELRLWNRISLTQAVEHYEALNDAVSDEIERQLEVEA